jgi:hypothetical protein
LKLEANCPKGEGGHPHGSKLDGLFWDEFGGEESELSKAAATIRNSYKLKHRYPSNRKMEKARYRHDTQPQPLPDTGCRSPSHPAYQMGAVGLGPALRGSEVILFENALAGSSAAWNGALRTRDRAVWRLPGLFAVTVPGFSVPPVPHNIAYRRGGASYPARGRVWNVGKCIVCAASGAQPATASFPRPAR